MVPRTSRVLAVFAALAGLIAAAPAPGRAGAATQPLALEPQTAAEPTVEPDLPAITWFWTPSPDLPYGTQAWLSWGTSNATAVSLEPGFPVLAASGSMYVDPPATLTYTLTASNALGSVTRSLTITRWPFRIMQFTSSRTSLLPGEAARLTWQVTGEGAASLDGIGPQPLVGTLDVSPQQSTHYTLRVQSGDQVGTQTVWVAVAGTGSGLPPGTIAMSFSPNSYSGLTAPATPLWWFHAYLIVSAPPGGMDAFEVSVQLPPGLLVTGGRVISPPFGDGGPFETMRKGDDNWIVGSAGVCVEDETVRLLSYHGCLWLAQPPPDAAITLGPSTPATIPGTPAYQTCRPNAQIRPLLIGPPLPIVPYSAVGAAAVRVWAGGVDGGIQIRWTLDGASSAQQIEVLRARPGGDFQRVALLQQDHVGSQGDWLDTDARPGIEYRYSVVAWVGGVAVSSAEATAERPLASPRSTRLLPNVPNPFNPSTELRFELAVTGDARLEIVDAAGRRVRRVVLKDLPAGPHAWTWNGDDDLGHPVSSGSYRVRLVAGHVEEARAVSLVR